jgi:DGQHR domain-containing protein
MANKAVDTITAPCIWAKQGAMRLACFSMKAKTLWKIVSINKRDADRDEGYQRVLSLSRVSAISRYINKSHAIPNSILVALENTTKISADNKRLIIPLTKKSGWVIDGQHRLAGAHEADIDIDLIVVAFLDLPILKQIEQFVTINKEAKGVPTSLYYDLLSKLPKSKTDAEAAKEKAVDIATFLRKSEDSAFYGKITVVTSPKRGELSLTNFVRKISPLLLKKSGKFSIYNTTEQIGIVDNYFKAVTNIFPYYLSGAEPILFQTLGFGALINVLPTVFDLSMTHYKTFKVEDISKIFKRIEDFDFEDWKQKGTGSAAEYEAGEDLRNALLLRFTSKEQRGALSL